jgi:hypothetical protein
MDHASTSRKIVRLHNDTIMSPLHPTIPTHAIACATLRETTGCPSKRPETEQHYAERIRTQVPSKWSEYLGLGTLRTRMIAMLRHSRRSKLSSNRNPIYPAIGRGKSCLESVFPENETPHPRPLTAILSPQQNQFPKQYFMLTINIPSFPTTSLP